jgi:hypothetical protein
VKMARTVLRGRDGGNAVLLPDYLYDYACPRDVRHGITRYMARYNGQRPHQALAYQTPVSVYFAPPPVAPGASGGPHDLPTATS